MKNITLNLEYESNWTLGMDINTIDLVEYKTSFNEEDTDKNTKSHKQYLEKSVNYNSSITLMKVGEKIFKFSGLGIRRL